MGPGYLKELKEPAGFMREPIKNPWFDGPVIWFDSFFLIKKKEACHGLNIRTAFLNFILFYCFFLGGGWIMIMDPKEQLRW
jgi:hypothetical protein